MSLGPDVHFASVRALGAMLRQGKVTSVQLAEESLARLESLGPKLGALVTLMRESALAEARARDAEAKAGRWRGPLHGIPYGGKDLLATKGVPTTWGAEPFRDQVFDHDATVVQRLREAGAVLVAKLAMVELAGGMGYNNPDASFTGPGRSPWNPAHWSGGSSSGSGAATAAGLVPFAIGSETSGSILTPATFCGLSGLRPTYGLVSRHGAMALCWTLDKLGPMCRTADDCALVLMAIAGADPADPTTVAGGFRYAPLPAGRRPKIGVLKNATARAQPEVQANFEASVAVLRGFADVEDGVEFPDYPYGPAVGIIVDAEGASAFRSLIESGGLKQLREKNDRLGGYPAMMTLAADYVDALRVRVPMRRALDALLARYDAVVAPTRTGVAPPIGYDFDKPPQPSPAPSPSPSPAADRPAPPATIPGGNLAGLPALCVPNGFGQRGLPTSLQFLGRAFSESALVDLAVRYQKATDWHARRPDLSGLAAAAAPPLAPPDLAAWAHAEPGRPDLYRL
jgi:Asp-tRNA(Asn)/Glu-tRNA(Gln) amidotransferase A subunit family amidase